GSAGARLRCVAGSWLASRMAMASPWPRAMAMSRLEGRRGRLASRALSEVRIGRSAENATSRFDFPATARTAAPTADLNAAVWSGLFGLLRGGWAIGLIIRSPLPSARLSSLRRQGPILQIVRAVGWVPAFAGMTPVENT